jgi:SAM-dependent methyltransferase
MSEFQTLSKPVDYAFPDEWYALASEDHFWIKWRFAAFMRQLTDLGLPLDAPWKGLDIGGGHGILRRQIEQRTQWVVDGADLNEEALRSCVASRGANLFYDIHDRRPEFAGVYDCLFLFDVLEHIEEPRPFLASALFHLRPGGWLFINVPAQERFRSEYDTVAGHVRRYDRGMMEGELAGHGVAVRDLRYWGLGLVPLALVRKVLTARSQLSPNEILRTGFEPPAPWVNTLLNGFMRLETRALRRPVLGTSLLAAAAKRADDGANTPA